MEQVDQDRVEAGLPTPPKIISDVFAAGSAASESRSGEAAPALDWTSAKAARFTCLALSVRAARPTARSALSPFELFLSSSDAPLAGRRLLRVFNPADELVASQRRDVVPSLQRRRVTDKRGAQVGRKLMNYATGHRYSGHTPILPRRNGVTVESATRSSYAQ